MTILNSDFAILTFTRALWEAELDVACHVLNLCMLFFFVCAGPFSRHTERRIHTLCLRWLKIRYFPRNAA